MLIEYLAHASFLLRSRGGTTIILDPYDPAIGYGALNRSCDALVISHEHSDHNHTAGVHGRALVLRNSPGLRNVGDIRVRGILACHDDCEGARLGYSVIAVLEVDGMRVCHAGDLGHVLTSEMIDEIGEVDLLLLPVGGSFTIGPPEARTVATQLGARMIVPMHYGTGQLRGGEFPLLRVDAFIEKQPSVRIFRQSMMELALSDLPKEPEILVMNHTF